MSNNAKPWEVPGFKFYTDEARAWLGGYVPTMGGELVAAAPKPPTPARFLATQEQLAISKERLMGVSTRRAGEMQIKPR